ncbi:MAG: imidazoleglycerol-phosphate dehydratase HisB [Candidatus Sumerlaeia bacterium]|nr:imidazoleglycerol-phosphate dehydratase HisB [Candidatus Sumerlaeia bacterium]
MSNRTAVEERQTRETQIKVILDLDGTGIFSGSLNIGFFEHMLDLLARHAFLDLSVEGHGDLAVDAHHTVEDTGILIGRAIRKALGDAAGMVRYGDAWVPMEEALAHVVLDICNRPYLAYSVPGGSVKIGDYDTELSEEFFRALCVNAGITAHIRLLAGSNTHHIQEAVFKAFGLALGRALARDPRIKGVHSTKGVL